MLITQISAFHTTCLYYFIHQVSPRANEDAFPGGNCFVLEIVSSTTVKREIQTSTMAFNFKKFSAEAGTLFNRAKQVSDRSTRLTQTRADAWPIFAHSVEYVSDKCQTMQISYMYYFSC